MTANRTLINAQTVIELLAEMGALTPAEIAVQTGIARSSVYRLIEGLAADGLARVRGDSTVELTTRWLHLADAVVPAMPEWVGARAVLDALADSTGQTAYLSVPRQLEAVCLAWAQGSGIDLLVLKPGRALPLYAGAAGRVILAHEPDSAEAVLAARERTVFTPRTLTSPADLRDDIARTLSQGWAFSDEDVTVGIGALGVPVYQGDEFVGCLSVAGLVDDIRAWHDELLHATSAAAAALVR